MRFRRALAVASGAHRFADPAWIWDGFGFEVGGIWQRALLLSDAADWRIQFVESELLNLHGDFSTNTAKLVTFFDDHQAVGFLDRFDDGIDVEWLDGAWVDDFAADALGFELLGCFKGLQQEWIHNSICIY